MRRWQWLFRGDLRPKTRRWQKFDKTVLVIVWLCSIDKFKYSPLGVRRSREDRTQFTENSHCMHGVNETLNTVTRVV